MENLKRSGLIQAPFPITFSTNGRVLADHPEYMDALSDLMTKHGRKDFFVYVQVTDDPRFYKQPLSEKQKYRLRKLG